jgi:hypothetical protein
MSSEQVCEGIDRLITIDVSGRGVIYRLYEAARSQSGKPLTLSAAESIRERLKEGDTVIITTGFRVLPDMIQETDGPLGAASIAKALAHLKAKPVILIERESFGIMRAALTSLGLREARNIEELGGYSYILMSFPYEISEAEEEAERVVSEYNPSIFLSIEKAGMAGNGRYHTMRGYDITDFHIKVEALLERAKKNGALTVAIGDGGNEVGMGNIREVVERNVPNGEKIASISTVDRLICAAVSNWGGYGLSAALSMMEGVKEALHTPEQEEMMLKSILEAGAVDGVTGKREESVDNIPMKVHSSIIRILEGLIKK